MPSTGLERHLLLFLGTPLRFLLQFSNLVHRREVYLALCTAGFVLKAVDVLCDPLIQCPVDGGTAGLKVAGDALDVPALGVERHDSEPAFYDVLYLVVGLKAPEHPDGRGVCFEYPPDRASVGPFAEADVADGGYLVVPHRRIVAFQVEDEPLDLRAQAALLKLLGLEQTTHPVALEAGDPASERGLWSSGLARPFGYGTTEDRRRAYPLVLDLLGPLQQ